MYTVIGGIHSRAFRVLWALEELGLSYTHLAAAPHSPEVLEHAPSGKIPVLVDQ
ncbi:MAG: glutathione S-transferase N-terminal domain-containing protein, partial [Paracoccaceae bacterium]